MSREKVYLPEDKLRNLYLDHRFSTLKIAKYFKCSPVTVSNRLREYRVKLRDKAHMRERYPKSPFSGDIAEKAYMVGFRLGDLNVYKPYSNSRIFVVRCHTTISEQVDLIRLLFSKYGGVKVADTYNGLTVNCFLDSSFKFLHKKVVPRWVFSRTTTAIPFIAGYIDAEGSFGLNQGRGRFKVDSYDYQILKRMNNFLERKRVRTKFRLIAKKGTRKYTKGKWNGDLWRLNINEATSLEKFIRDLLPYSRHEKRISDAMAVLENISKRKTNGTIT